MPWWLIHEIRPIEAEVCILHAEWLRLKQTINICHRARATHCTPTGNAPFPLSLPFGTKSSGHVYPWICKSVEIHALWARMYQDKLPQMCFAGMKACYIAGMEIIIAHGISRKVTYLGLRLICSVPRFISTLSNFIYKIEEWRE